MKLKLVRLRSKLSTLFPTAKPILAVASNEVASGKINTIKEIKRSIKLKSIKALAIIMNHPLL